MQVIIQYKKVKNITIRIKVNGLVVVSAPYNTPDKYIQELLELRANWINKHLDRFNKIRSNEVTGNSVDEIVILGKTNRIILTTGVRANYEFRANELRVSVPEPQNNRQVEQVINRFRLEYAYAYFTQLIEKNFDYFAKLGKAIPSLQVRQMKSRWGSYSLARNKINLNLQLISYDVELINYVVVHELCHIIHQNHSQKFYNLMSELLPNWQEYRCSLKDKAIDLV